MIYILNRRFSQYSTLKKILKYYTVKVSCLIYISNHISLHAPRFLLTYIQILFNWFWVPEHLINLLIWKMNILFRVIWRKTINRPYIYKIISLLHDVVFFSKFIIGRQHCACSQQWSLDRWWYLYGIFYNVNWKNIDLFQMTITFLLHKYLNGDKIHNSFWISSCIIITPS